jgi:GTPase Era involved in 16S rRNA processing
LLDDFTTWVFTERVRNAIGKHQLDTLRSQARSIQTRIKSEFTLVVLGEFKRGKSTLVNALLRAPIATTDVTPETLTINQIHYGPQALAEIRLRDGGKVNLSIDQLKSDQLVPILDEIRGSGGSKTYASGADLRIRLHHILTEYFDLSEFKDLCFTLGIHYDHLPGDALPGKARELIGRMQRHLRLNELIRACYAARPHLKDQAAGELSETHNAARAIATAALHAKLAELQDRVSHLVIQTPVEWLQGVCLVDTPGINDLDRFDEQVGHYLSQADAIIFVLSARAPFAETERTFLQRYVLPRDFAKVFFVVNEMDRLNSREHQRLLQEIRFRIHDLFPQAPVFGVSALQEYEQTQFPESTHVEYPALAQEFERFRTTLQDSLLLNRDIIRLERTLLQTEEMLQGLENHIERLHWAISASQQSRDAAIAEYRDRNSALNRKLEQHKQQLHTVMDELCDQACIWIDEFLVRFEHEAVPYIEHVQFDETQRHFHFFLSDALRAAIANCIDTQRPFFLDLVSSARQSIQTDMQAINSALFTNRDIDQSIAQITPSNASWANLDGVRVLVDQSLIGMFGFAEDLVMPLASLLAHRQKQTEEQRKEKYQEYVSSTMPELRTSVMNTLRDLYRDLGIEVEKLIEEGYQQDIESSLSALQEAQDFQAEGEQERAIRQQNLEDVSILVADMRDKLRVFKQRHWPEEIFDEASATAAS